MPSATTGPSAPICAPLGYHDLLVEAALIKSTIHGHPRFAAFIAGLEAHFKKWGTAAAVSLRKLRQDCLPKEVIREHAERLLAHAEGQPLIDPYAVYQHLMDYWAGRLLPHRGRWLGGQD
jgi:type I restriction enzyme M protein